MSWIFAAALALIAQAEGVAEPQACEEATPRDAWAAGRTVEQISYGMFHFAGPRDAYCYPTQQCRGEADPTGSNCEPMALHELTVIFQDHPDRFHAGPSIMLGGVSVARPEGVLWVRECAPFGWHDYHRRNADPSNGTRECLLAPESRLRAFGDAVRAGAEAAGYRPIPGQDPALPRAFFQRGCNLFGWYVGRSSSVGLVMPLEGGGEPEIVEVEDWELDVYLFERPITPPSGVGIDPQTGEAVNPASGRPVSEDPWTEAQCTVWAEEGVGWFY